MACGVCDVRGQRGALRGVWERGAWDVVWAQGRVVWRVRCGATKKVSEYYKQNYSQIFHDIDGNDQIDKITSKIKKIIKNT